EAQTVEVAHIDRATAGACGLGEGGGHREREAAFPRMGRDDGDAGSCGLHGFTIALSRRGGLIRLNSLWSERQDARSGSWPAVLRMRVDERFKTADQCLSFGVAGQLLQNAVQVGKKRRAFIVPVRPGSLTRREPRQTVSDQLRLVAGEGVSLVETRRDQSIAQSRETGGEGG